MLREVQIILTHVDSQKCEQDIEIIPPNFFIQFHLRKIHKSNEENDHENSQEIREVIFTILNFF